MKTKINLNLLKKSIKKAYKLLPKKTSFPLLDCFFFSFSNNKMILQATDLFSGIIIENKAVVEEEGKVVVNGKFFSEIISSLDGEEIILSCNEKTLNLETKKEKINLTILNYEEYPEIKELKKEKMSFFLKKEQAEEIEKKLSFSVSNDLNKPIFNSFYLEIKKKKILFVGTDSVRLGILTYNQENENEKNVLIPKKNMIEIISLIKEESGEKVDFFINEEENQLFFKKETIFYFTKLNSGQYPPYEKIFPEKNDFRITVNKDNLLNLLKKVVCFVRDSSNIIKMTVGKEKIFFSANSNLNGKYDGFIKIVNESQKETKIAFNVLYLIDYLISVEGEQIEIMLSNSSRPALFKDNDRKHYQHLIMPFALNE